MLVAGLKSLKIKGRSGKAMLILKPEGGRGGPNNEINLPAAFMFNECRVDLFSICLQISQGSEQSVYCWLYANRPGEAQAG